MTSDPPLAGTAPTFRCFNAPSNAVGLLVLGAVPSVEGIPFAGSRLYVWPGPGTFFAAGAATNEEGYAEATPPTLPAALGASAFAQFVWVNPPGCTGRGSLSSSDALELTLLH